MMHMLCNGKRIWYLAFYYVVGRVPTDSEASDLQKLRVAVLKGKVTHSSSTRVWIPKPGTEEKRGLTVSNYADRIIGKVILLVLSPIRESVFPRVSSGFRMAWDRQKGMIRLMNKLTPDSKLLSVDIRKCFDRISHEQLEKIVIERWRLPKGFEKWVLSSLVAEVMDPERDLRIQPSEGTPQGAILSPLLCNEALHDLDVMLKDGIYDRYADNLIYDEKHDKTVREYLSKCGLEIKESSIERLQADRPIVHLGCELILEKEFKKLTIWFKRITPIYAPKQTKPITRVRAVLPKLRLEDPRRALAGMSGYWAGKGPITLGTKLISPYASLTGKPEVWTNPFDEKEDKEGKLKYLTWCAISPYDGTDTWYASKTCWESNNPVTGEGKPIPLDYEIISNVKKNGVARSPMYQR